MLERIRIRNFKALRDVTLDLTPIHVLIGPNDSGKSSILEAIAALSRSADEVSPRTFPGLWEGQELVWKGASDPVVSFDIRANDPEGPIEASIGFGFKAEGRDALVTSQRFAGGGVKLDWNSRTNRTQVYAAMRGLNSPPEEIRLLCRLHSLLSGVQYYRFEPHLLALAAAPQSDRSFRMDPSGFGLSMCLDDILGYDRERFAELEARFRGIFPEIRSIKLVRGPAFTSPANDITEVPQLRSAEGKILKFELAANGALIPASQASDGVLLVLAYLAVLHLPRPPRFLLVEEPENGIHPQRLDEIVRIVRDVVETKRETQVVMTTHSPYLLDSFQPEEVTVCHKGEDGAVRVRRLSESPAVREREDFFSLGEIWTSRGDAALVSEETEDYEG